MCHNHQVVRQLPNYIHVSQHTNTHPATKQQLKSEARQHSWHWTIATKCSPAAPRTGSTGCSPDPPGKSSWLQSCPRAYRNKYTHPAMHQTCVCVLTFDIWSVQPVRCVCVCVCLSSSEEMKGPTVFFLHPNNDICVRNRWENMSARHIPNPSRSSRVSWVLYMRAYASDNVNVVAVVWPTVWRSVCIINPLSRNHHRRRPEQDSNEQYFSHAQCFFFPCTLYFVFRQSFPECRRAPRFCFNTRNRNEYRQKHLRARSTSIRYV